MFNPTLNTRLTIDGVEFRFSPHPVVPTLVWGQEGRHAIVYRIEPTEKHRRPLDAPNGTGYALKVFRPVFRHPGLLQSAEALRWAHELPGMQVCNQVVITQDTHPDLVKEYEDLDYAMVMPWIEGQTWFDFLQTKERITLDESRAMAEHMAWVLYALEMNNLAHCDLSSGNVIIDPGQDRIHLVDVEDLYSPWLSTPPMVPAGTPGYQHKEANQIGQWRPAGDRFAGAVLMAEMLGWAHPEVREHAYSESYFAPDELQRNSERLEILVDVLEMYDAGFAEAFEEAWSSPRLESCPPLKTWYDLVDDLPREPVAEWAPLDPESFEGETERPAEVAVPVAASAAAMPVGGVLSSQTAPATQQAPGLLRRVFRKGCRAVAFITGALLIIACFALVLAVQWSFAQGILP